MVWPHVRRKKLLSSIEMPKKFKQDMNELDWCWLSAGCLLLFKYSTHSVLKHISFYGWKIFLTWMCAIDLLQMPNMTRCHRFCCFLSQMNDRDCTQFFFFVRYNVILFASNCHRPLVGLSGKNMATTMETIAFNIEIRAIKIKKKKENEFISNSLRLRRTFIYIYVEW